MSQRDAAHQEHNRAIETASTKSGVHCVKEKVVFKPRLRRGGGGWLGFSLH